MKYFITFILFLSMCNHAMAGIGLWLGGKNCPELFQHLKGVKNANSEIQAYYKKFLNDHDSVPKGAKDYFEPTPNSIIPTQLTGSSAFQDLRVTKKSYSFKNQIDGYRFSKIQNGSQSKDYLDWQNAHKKFVENSTKIEITVETLKEIHGTLAKRQFYPGFERRRIREAYKKGLLTEEEAVRALLLVDEGIAFTKIDHSSLAGQLRKDPIDVFVFTGEPSSNHYIPQETFRELSANPFFWLDPSSVKGEAKEGYQARFFYTPPELVEQTTRKVIENASIRLKNAANDEEYIRITAALVRDLVTIHPFLDGNGRSIRLFADVILAKRGLALPLQPLKEGGLSEYTDDLDSIAREIALQMRLWKKRKMGQ